MTPDDRDLAALLGETPPAPDPGFRFDVFARIAERKRRRAAWAKAIQQAGTFTVIGLLFPAAHALGGGLPAAQTSLLVAGALGLAYVLAVLAKQGPAGLAARSRVLIRS